MSAVSHDIAEKERQLQMHEERLKTLENLKKVGREREGGGACGSV